MFVPLSCNTKTRQGEPEDQPVVNTPLKIAPLRPDNDPELLQMHNDKCQLRRARDNLTKKIKLAGERANLRRALYTYLAKLVVQKGHTCSMYNWEGQAHRRDNTEPCTFNLTHPQEKFTVCNQIAIADLRAHTSTNWCQSHPSCHSMLPKKISVRTHSERTRQCNFCKNRTYSSIGSRPICVCVCVCVCVFCVFCVFCVCVCVCFHEYDELPRCCDGKNGDCDPNISGIPSFYFRQAPGQKTAVQSS